jgi:serine/threonine protein kinase
MVIMVKQKLVTWDWQRSNLQIMCIPSWGKIILTRTPEFMAPEFYDEKYDEKVDIYAFGMVFFH